MAKPNSINAIDIGSSKITCLITLPSSESPDRINVVGVATLPSKGIRKGQIVNIENAVTSITDCVEAAERMAGFNINSAFISVSGEHIKSQNSQGVVAITEPEGEISQEDIFRVIEAARAISLPSSREIIHVLPREYVVDSQKGIKDPVSMSGVRLETEAHLVTGSTTAIKNITKCINEIGIEVSALVFSGLASSHSILTETEKELGVILVDIGAGVTNISIYVEGACSYSTVISIGARKVTDDLAIGLMISLDSAEKIKHHISTIKSDPTSFKSTDEINLSKMGIKEDIKKISRKTLTEGIIRPRLNEIFSMIASAIKKSGFVGQTPAGIVLTGGGSQTIAALDACRRVIQLPTRLGSPSGLHGLTDEIDSPAYATAVGLINFGISRVVPERTLPSINLGSLFKKIPTQDIGKKVSSFFKSFLP